MKRGATERNLLIAVKLSEGLNFSATFRSEAKEKFKVEKEGVLSIERMRYIKN
jgi:hypothetical protein